MMRRLLSSRSLPYIVLAFVGINALFAVLSVYAIKFSVPGHPVLSASSEEWAHFGEYVGGTLGPVYGLLAFIGVLATLDLQNQQMADQRKQFELGELQRLMAGLSQAIDQQLASEPVGLNDPARLRLTRTARSLSIFDLLSALGTRNLTPPASYIVSERRADVDEYAKQFLTQPVNAILIELQHLEWCMREYARQGGGSTLQAYYHQRYAFVVAWIFLCGLLDSEPVRAWFNPEKLVEHLNRVAHPVNDAT